MRIAGKLVSKSNLPEKVCPVCQRPFSWRKKWSRCWNEVIYCSQRCRHQTCMKTKKLSYTQT